MQHNIFDLGLHDCDSCGQPTRNVSAYETLCPTCAPLLLAISQLVTMGQQYAASTALRDLYGPTYPTPPARIAPILIDLQPGEVW